MGCVHTQSDDRWPQRRGKGPQRRRVGVDVHRDGGARRVRPEQALPRVRFFARCGRTRSGLRMLCRYSADFFDGHHYVVVCLLVQWCRVEDSDAVHLVGRVVRDNPSLRREALRAQLVPTQLPVCLGRRAHRLRRLRARMGRVYHCRISRGEKKDGSHVDRCTCSSRNICIEWVTCCLNMQ